MTSALALRRGDLAEAARLAVDGFDWCYLAIAYLRAKQDGHVRCLERATASPDLVVARNVARIYHRELGDRDAAARVLAPHGQELLREPSARGWSRYAAAWDDLGDRDAARDALAHAGGVAASVQDCCDVALGFHLVGDRPAAHAAIANAERAATDTDQRLTTVNAALYALEDPALAHDMLMRARRAAPTARDVIRVDAARADLFDEDGHAPDTTPGAPEAPEMLYRDSAEMWALCDAERRATSLDDWIAVGLAWKSHHSDHERDVCFEHAEALATDDAARARIANARDPYTYPLAQHPDALLPRRDALGYAPEPAPLFDLLRARMTPAQLEALAANDYGFGAEEGYPRLLEICASGLVPVELPGNLRENVELERWGHGSDYVSHAFACTVMCLAGPGFSGGEEESMSTLVESCMLLGDVAVRGLLGLFAAMPEHLFIALGIVLAAARRDPTDPWLGPAIARVVEIDRMRNRGDWPGGFVFGISNYAQRYDHWRTLARSILDHPVPLLADFARRLGT